AQRAAVAIQAELQRVLHMSRQFLLDLAGGDDDEAQHEAQHGEEEEEQVGVDASGRDQLQLHHHHDTAPAAQATSDAQDRRKRTGKRRFDSGLGLLAEDQADGQAS
ncbi:hypothetical protein E4U42_006098, partial [Claviceps africana]